MAKVLSYAARRYLSKVNIQGPSAVAGGHDDSYKLWKKLSLFVGIPAIIVCGVNCYLTHHEAGHHRPEFIKYEYMRMRTKRFPWGDGTKSLFHNKEVNALPDGYEE